MNKRYFLLLTAFLFNVSCILCQKSPNDTINKTDSTGRKQGYWKKKDKDGSLKYEGRFINDKPTGIFKYYYPDKNIKAITIFRDSMHSKTTAYHPNGKVLSEGCYYGTIKDSTWRFYNEYGKIVSEESYIRGVKNNLWKVFYTSNGNVSEEVTWKNNVKDGPWHEFFENGSIRLKAIYNNGHTEGLFQSFYINGKVELSGTYKLSQKDGIWISFAENGESNYKEIYRKGNLKKKEIYVKVDSKIKPVEIITVAFAYSYEGKIKLVLKDKHIIPVEDDMDRLEFLLGSEKFIRINKSAVVCYDVIKGVQVQNEKLLKVITIPVAEIELIADEGSSEFLITRYKAIK